MRIFLRLGGKKPKHKVKSKLLLKMIAVEQIKNFLKSQRLK